MLADLAGKNPNLYDDLMNEYDQQDLWRMFKSAVEDDKVE